MKLPIFMFKLRINRNYKKTVSLVIPLLVPLYSVSIIFVFSTGRKAADCYLKAANVQEKQGDTSRQAGFLQDAGNVLKKVSSEGRSTPLR